MTDKLNVPTNVLYILTDLVRKTSGGQLPPASLRYANEMFMLSISPGNRGFLGCLWGLIEK